MPQYFFDTSAIIKRYHPEAGTPKSWISSPHPVASPDYPPSAPLSALGAVELQSALAVKTRTGHLTAAGARALSGIVLNDIATGLIQPHTITQSHLSVAEQSASRRF